MVCRLAVNSRNIPGFPPRTPHPLLYHFIKNPHSLRPTIHLHLCLSTNYPPPPPPPHNRHTIQVYSERSSSAGNGVEIEGATAPSPSQLLFSKREKGVSTSFSTALSYLASDTRGSRADNRTGPRRDVSETRGPTKKMPTRAVKVTPAGWIGAGRSRERPKLDRWIATRAAI